MKRGEMGNFGDRALLASIYYSTTILLAVAGWGFCLGLRGFVGKMTTVCTAIY